jgi:hypothetical protein
MNFDERLERIAERHEALAQSIELLTHDINEFRAATKERHEALAQSVELMVAEGKQTGERVRHLAIIAEQNEVRAGHMMDTMSRLGRILEIHDAQIGQHAHRLDQLEG